MLVVYKSGNDYCVTSESNYKSYIQNVRKIQRLQGFNSADEVIGYYVTHNWATYDEFIVIDR